MPPSPSPPMGRCWRTSRRSPPAAPPRTAPAGWRRPIRTLTTDGIGALRAAIVRAAGGAARGPGARGRGGRAHGAARGARRDRAGPAGVPVHPDDRLGAAGAARRVRAAAGGPAAGQRAGRRDRTARGPGVDRAAGSPHSPRRRRCCWRYRPPCVPRCCPARWPGCSPGGPRSTGSDCGSTPPRWAWSGWSRAEWRRRARWRSWRPRWRRRRAHRRGCVGCGPRRRRLRCGPEPMWGCC
ncbi:hypothetical protein SPURM210S_03366 [Streptomyces purpurascens]